MRRHYCNDRSAILGDQFGILEQDFHVTSEILFSSYVQFLEKRKDHLEGHAINRILESIVPVEDFMPIADAIISSLASTRGPISRSPAVVNALSLIVDCFCRNPCRFIENKQLLYLCIDLLPSNCADICRLFWAFQQQLGCVSLGAFEFLPMYVKVLILKGEPFMISPDLLRELFKLPSTKYEPSLLLDVFNAVPTLFKQSVLELFGKNPKQIGSILNALSCASCGTKDGRANQSNASLIDLLCHGLSLLFSTRPGTINYDSEEKAQIFALYLDSLLYSDVLFWSEESNIAISAQLLLIIGALDSISVLSVENSEATAIQMLMRCSRLLHLLVKSHFNAVLNAIPHYEFAFCRLVSHVIELFSSQNERQGEPDAIKGVLCVISKIFSEIRAHSESNFMKYMIPLCVSLLKILIRKVSDSSSSNLLLVRNVVSETLYELLNSFTAFDKEVVFSLLSPEIERPFFKDLYSRFNNEFKYHGKV
ncbi:hypothetical protein MDAP_000924 [Mitosporidium daphniae]